MKHVSKVLIGLLITMLIITAMPFMASAYPYYDQNGNYRYDIVSDSNSPDYGSAIIEFYLGSERVVSIPQYLGGHKVIRLSGTTFHDKKDVKEVIIPEGVTQIDKMVFLNLESLEKVTIPDSVRIIGDNQFALCSQLKEVVVHNHTVDIYRNAFDACHPSLTIYAAPDTVYEKHANRFRLGFKPITENTVPAVAKYDKSSDFRYLVLEDGTINITNYEGSNSIISIPPKIDGRKVTRIHNSAFYDRDFIKEVTIPEGVTYIGRTAFIGCTSLEKVTIPDSVTKIDKSAFSFCSQLKDVVVHNHTVDIGEDIFEACHASLTIHAAPDTIYEKLANENGYNFISNVQNNNSPEITASAFTPGTIALLCGGCVLAIGIVSTIIILNVKKKKKKEYTE